MQLLSYSQTTSHKKWCLVKKNAVSTQHKNKKHEFAEYLKIFFIEIFGTF